MKSLFIFALMSLQNSRLQIKCIFYYLILVLSCVVNAMNQPPFISLKEYLIYRTKCRIYSFKKILYHGSTNLLIYWILWGSVIKDRIEFLLFFSSLIVKEYYQLIILLYFDLNFSTWSIYFIDLFSVWFLLST
jgi:hypothetical protein